MTRSALARAAIVTLLGAGVVACGGGKKEPPPPVERESASDEVLRVGEVWKATVVSRGLLSPPSAISVRQVVHTSTVHLTPTSAKEDLVIEENLELRSGSKLHCKTTFSHDVAVRYGRRQGEPAVELVRPSLQKERTCDGRHPEGAIVEPANRALFVLRSDRLVVVEPALEDRYYLPEAY